MPELPEVEVVKKSLEKEINNFTIKNVKINDGNLRYKVKKQDINKIIGLRIIKIKRRSKYLIFFLSKSFVMIVHLGMTGKFFIVKKKKFKQKTSFYYEIKNSSEKHDRIIFFLKKNIQLIYNDVRKFGFIKIIKLNKIKEINHLKKLVPEHLGDFFNFNYFKNYLIGINRKIKDLLMDQKFIAGLGNIYVNEILLLSRVKQKRIINKLKNQEITKIIINTKKILKKAIILGGSSIKDFSNSSGKKGNFQQHFNVYGKEGLRCNNSGCIEKIKKIVISNRSSLFCSKCQK